MNVDELEGAVTWCVPAFADAARERKLPGAYRGERFWHGKATVERHRHWVVVVPLSPGVSAVVAVGFDGSWSWVARPSPRSDDEVGDDEVGDDEVGELTLDDVQAAFDRALDAG